MASAAGMPAEPEQQAGAGERRIAGALSTLAVIRLDFDPEVRIGTLDVRWQALALAFVVLIGLVAWSRRLGAQPGHPAVGGPAVRRPGDHPRGRWSVGASSTPSPSEGPTWPSLRALFDVSQGSLSLLGAVLGGMLAGAYVCRLLSHSPSQWADAAAGPLLLAIGLGKLAMVLGGAGQGAPIGAPWAVAFDGAGPWTSPDPAVPAHPSQVYEGIWALAGIVAVARLARRWTPLRQGDLFILTLAWWLTGRVIAGLTWRDATLVGPLGVEAMLALIGARRARGYAGDTDEGEGYRGHHPNDRRCRRGTVTEDHR